MLILAMFNVSLFAQGVTPVQPVGSGTASDPYQITFLSNLRWLSENSSSTWWGSSTTTRYYIQTANIDASETVNWNGGEGFSPIGNSGSNFFGNYNGDGKTISNLHIARTSSYIGLFGYIGNTTIQNVNLVNVNITSSNTNAYTGALVGFSYIYGPCTIIDCSVSGNISGYANSMGGLIGSAYNTLIAKSSSKVNINTSNYDNMVLGGLVGTLTNSSKIINSYYYGNLQYNAPNPTATIQQYKGGLVGNVQNSDINFCYVTSSSAFSNTIGGGFAGTVSNNSIIANSFWNTTTTGLPWYNTPTGNNANLTGLNTNAMKQQSSYTNWNFNANFGIWNINSSTNDGYPYLRPPQAITQAVQPIGSGTASDPYQITFLSNLRWLSENSSSTWWGSSSTTRYYIQTANIDAAETAIWNGGEGFSPIGNSNSTFFSNFNGDGKTISNLHIYRTSSYIGLFGYIGNSTIQNVNLVNVNITTSNTNAYTGALVGFSYIYGPCTITDCSVSGNIFGHANSLGGLIGYAYNTLIAKSSSKVNINTSNYDNIDLGGLVGSLSNSSKIINSYFYGNLDHTGITINNKGGLVGSVQSSSSINFCYVTSSSVFSNIGGGVAGTVSNNSIIANSFWNITTTGLTTTGIYTNSAGANASANGRNTTEMKQQATYINWNFNANFGIWNINSSTNDGYPYLRPPQSTTQPIEPAGAGTSANPYQITFLANLRWLSENSSSTWWGSSSTTRYYIQTANIDASETAIWNGGEGFSPIGNSNSTFFSNFNGDGKTISNLHIYRTSSYIGLFGYIGNSTIQNVNLVNVNITTSNTNAYTGALVGFSYIYGPCTITDCSVSGNISGYASSLGGLVGYAYNTQIAKSSSKANINTSNYDNIDLGGLVGSLSNSSKIINSYFYGNLNHTGTTINNKGGLVGSASSSSTIDITYVASTAAFTNIGGGMVGTLNSGCSISNSYWDTQTTGRTAGVATGTGTNNAAGRTTAQMKTQSNFTGWDFTSIWHKDPANYINSGYPYLINELSATIPTITTHPLNQTVCAGQTTQFTVESLGATSHQWQVSTNGGTSFSNVTNGTGGTAATYTTIATITDMNNYRYRCIVTNSNGSVTSNSATLTVTNSVPAQPSTISGNTTVCYGTTNLTYSVTNVSGVTYNWTLPTGWTKTAGGNTNSITVTAGSYSGNITVTPSNSCGNGTARTLAVTVNSVPSQPSTITGNTTVCSGTTGLIYSVTNVSGVTYNWVLPTGWTKTAGGNTNSITVTASSSSGTITVTPSNSCGNGTARTLSVTVNTVPSQPSTITGNNPACSGAIGQTYSVTNVSGVTYNWNLPSGWTQTGGGTTNNITVTAGTSGGNITVTPSNSCGNGTARTLSVTVNTIPAQPSTITGNNPVCSGTTGLTYSVTNVSGVTYNWTLPTGWTQTGGGTTNNITVTAGTSGGNITVTPSNSCGNGTTQTLPVTVNTVPSQPSAISGNNPVCFGTTGLIYSVTNVSGVTYNWTLPSGWTQTGGGTTNSITVTAGTAGGNITVTPSNSCGNGTAQTLPVTVNTVPSQPSAITGNNPVCSGTTGLTYSVTNVSGVTYNWILPTGWTISNGQNTNSIIVTAGTAGGNITVTPSNSCGNGTAQTLPVTVNTVPSQPSAITGNNPVCSGTTGLTYSVTNVSGVTYNWTLPTGWTQTGGGTTNSITVTTGTAGGNITVTPSNSCGNGTAQTLPVTVNTVPSQPSTITGNTAPCSGTTGLSYSVTNVSGVTYNWTLPTGWTQTGGGTTNYIMVTAGTAGGNITVTPSNSCGNGTAQTLLVTVNTVPAQPSTITGNNPVCSGTTGLIYSVTNISGVTYNWTLPTGWTQTGGGTTNSIMVTAGTAGGNITVTPSNSCGNGTAQTLPVTVNFVPSQPSTITGNTTVCSGESGLTYSVTNESGVTYNWILPTGWTQIGGGTTNSITVTAGTAGGNISVTPSNDCGNGAAQTLLVTVTIPVIEIIDVPETATANTPLSLTGTVVPDNATSQNIEWILVNAGNTGASIVGNTFFANSEGTAFIKAYIENGICIGEHYEHPFTITVGTVGTGETVPSTELKIFPNPTNDELFIKSDLQIEKVEVYSLLGSLLISENNFKEKISVSALSAGIYFLKVHTEKGLVISKVVKE